MRLPMIWLLPLPLLAASPGWSQQDAPAAAVAEPAGDFESLYGQWNDNLQRLSAIRDEYERADADQRDALRREYNELIESGEGLLDRLTEAAKSRFEGDPKPRGDAALFLAEVVRDRVRRDDYEPAYEVSRLLLEHGSTAPGLNNSAAIAAFCTNHFDDAGAWFAKIDPSQLDQVSGHYKSRLPYYQRAWKAEQQKRAAEAEADNLPRVRLTTTKGDVTIELFENEAPNTVANFVKLVEDGFYDGLTFHRVLPGFMAQGGCPKGDGTGGPGHHIPCECYDDRARTHFRGTLSMAHAGRDTGGSQFFLNFVPTDNLDGKHTVFGRVIEGLDVLGKLQRRNPDARAKIDPDKILTAKVIRKRDHPYQPQTLPATR